MSSIGRIDGFSGNMPVGDKKVDELQEKVSEKKITVPEAVATELSPRVKNALSKTFKYLVRPTSFLSSASGVLSFLLATCLKKQNDYVDKFSTYSCKAAIFTSGLFGVIKNATNKDFFTTLGYAADFLTSIVGQDKNLYLLKGFGSAFDQVSAMLRDASHNPGVKALYKLNDGNEWRFNLHQSFYDSAKKTFSAVKIIGGDIISECKSKFKSGGFFSALSAPFIGVTSSQTTERNLLVSTLGLLVSSFCGTALKLTKFGGSLRDLFGLHADVAVLLKKFSKTKTGEKTGEGNDKYGLSGLFYGLGSIVDLISRWVPSLENLHLAALGIDRLGNYHFLDAIMKDHGQVENGNGH